MAVKLANDTINNKLVSFSNATAGEQEAKIVKNTLDGYAPLDQIFGTRIADAIYTLRHWGKPE